MVTVVNDPDLERCLQAERAASGADRYDEMWEGTYMMAPMPNDEHQELVTWLGSIFQLSVGAQGRASVRVGVNVSDRKDGWMQNYRVPDVAVFLKEGQAENCDAFWYGGPDLAVEIVSPGDLTWDKLPFYQQVGVRELLVIDREPWRIVLHRLQEQRLVVVAEARPDDGTVVESGVLPFTFRLTAGPNRPRLEVIHTTSGECWLI